MLEQNLIKSGELGSSEKERELWKKERCLEIYRCWQVSERSIHFGKFYLAFRGSDFTFLNTRHVMNSAFFSLILNPITPSPTVHNSIKHTHMNKQIFFALDFNLRANSLSFLRANSAPTLYFEYRSDSRAAAKNKRVKSKLHLKLPLFKQARSRASFAHELKQTNLCIGWYRLVTFSSGIALFRLLLWFKI